MPSTVFIPEFQFRSPMLVVTIQSHLLAYRVEQCSLILSREIVQEARR
jgi:hypothetical protein